MKNLIIKNPGLVNEIITGLKEHGRVKITGLGIFESKERKARKGRNPNTGEPVEIPARKRVVFRATKALRTL